jgi:hypothetical protein
MSLAVRREGTLLKLNNLTYWFTPCKRWKVEQKQVNGATKSGDVGVGHLHRVFVARRIQPLGGHAAARDLRGEKDILSASITSRSNPLGDSRRHPGQVCVVVCSVNVTEPV